MATDVVRNIVGDGKGDGSSAMAMAMAMALALALALTRSQQPATSLCLLATEPPRLPTGVPPSLSRQQWVDQLASLRPRVRRAKVTHSISQVVEEILQPWTVTKAAAHRPYHDPSAVLVHRFKLLGTRRRLCQLV